MKAVGIPVMKQIDIYDPPMCCPTGICGPAVDPVLVELAAMLARLGREGVKVRRFNLAQQPAAFSGEPAVRNVLEESGVDGLPVVMVDGEIVVKGRYPSGTEMSDWLAMVKGKKS